jgi:hypothetical protein
LTGLVEGRWQCPPFHALRTQLEPGLRSEKAPRADKWRRTAARQRDRLVRSQRTGLGTEVPDDLSHLNGRPCTLHQCRAHSPYQVQCSCRYCQPLLSPRPFTSSTSITGMATASFQAIISRPTTTFQFMVRRDQSAALQAIRQATGITADGTISAIPGFSMDAITAAVSARAGLGRLSGGCGIVVRNTQKSAAYRRSHRTRTGYNAG